MSDVDYCLYILRCADGSLYTGIARDVQKRLAEHASGKRGAKYLRGRSPFELVYECAAGDRSNASQLEYTIKQLSRAQKQEIVDGTLAIASIAGRSQASGASSA